MNFPISSEVKEYKRVSDKKAGLKEVYILTTENGKFVLSEGQDGGENWFSGCFVEPYVNEWLEDNWGEDKVPSVIEKNIKSRRMISEYMGIKDGQKNPEVSKSFGTVLGKIHSIDEFEGFGGMVIKNERLLSERNDWSEFLISRFKNMSGNYVDTARIDGDRLSGVTNCLSHGDAKFQNVRIDNQSNISCVLDWQNAWVSDGLTEFLHSRLRCFGTTYDTKESFKFTEGYKENMPEYITGYTDYQSTISLLYAISRLKDYEFRTGKTMHESSENDHLERVLEKFSRLKNTISVNQLINKNTNLSDY